MDKDRHDKGGVIDSDVIDSDSPISTLGCSFISEELQFRKALWVPYQIVKKHLEQIIIPHCQHRKSSSTEQLVAAIETFHRSLLPENAIPPKDTVADITNEDNQTVLITLPPGIKNLGATCYLNSQLQCLSLNPVFREGVISWQKMLTTTSANSTPTNLTSTMSGVMQRLQKILFMMHCGSYSVISAEKLAQSLGIENDEMQDPNEFSRLLFDRMHEMFQESNEMKDLLPNIFQGTCEYVTECQKCHTRSVREEHFMELTLPILKGTSSADVQSFLDSYLSTKELLTGDNQYACDLCKTKCDASREIHLRSVPPVLNLQLSRYIFDLKTFTKRKTLAKVRLPSAISIPIETSEEKYTTTTYPDRLNSKRRRTNGNGNSKNYNINTNSKLAQKEYILCGVVSTAAHSYF
jgi:ubiquitin C-terminal hydrolase